MELIFNCEVSPVEREAVTWLATKSRYIQATVTRRSATTFDLQVEGMYDGDTGQDYVFGETVLVKGIPTTPFKIVKRGPMVKPQRFSAWFVLACLRWWYSDPEWSLYIDDCGTGDWSFIRDADLDQIWGMFASIVRAAEAKNAGLPAPMAPVRNTTQGVRVYLH